MHVVAKGIAAHGVPQRLLTDNGVALNPSRRGIVGQLVDYVTRLGVKPIAGKPYKPTTQGKNERFHQTLFRYLDKQPVAATLAQMQAHVDEFDRIYNTERPHQGLPGHHRMAASPTLGVCEGQRLVRPVGASSDRRKVDVMRSSVRFRQAAPANSP
ncbi:Integrase core domain protein [Microbacterium laevaniformans]|uniref:Integrase core domain protein n=1 Tax=Microbacterium laevaniformans TaxID=36807 RepID=A0A150H5Y5_9MICO|nr:Integrase core domain protein [Microbacterium laevaniformans]